MKIRLLSFALLALLFAPSVMAATPKTYIAKLSQGSGTPEALEIENTLGVVTYSRIEEGRFRLICSQCFPDETKVLGLREFHFTDTNGKYLLEWDDEGGNGDSLILTTYTSNGVLSDNILSLTEIRIVVYPSDV